MSLSPDRESRARSKRRTMIEQFGTVKVPSVNVLLPEPQLRRGQHGLTLPYPSEVFPTAYLNRLPEWRWRAGNSAYRDHWRNTREYMMVTLGCTVGITNFFNFSMLALRFRKGPFLYIYLLIQFLIGFPMLFLHLALGQFTAKDAAWLFSLVPLARGISVSFMIYSLVQTIMMNVELSWITYYMFATFNIKLTPSFSWKLPWANCVVTEEEIHHQIQCGHYPKNMLNDTQFYCISIFFHDFVLGNTGDCVLVNGHWYHTGNDLEMNWPLVGCLLFVTCFVYVIAFRGLKTIGRFVFVVVPSSCVLLLLFLSYEIVLEDAETVKVSLESMVEFIAPENGFNELVNWDIWFTAAIHVMRSLSLDTAAMIYIGSNAHFQSAAHYHAFYVVVVDVGFSVLTAIVVFSHMGVVDKRLGSHDLDALEYQGRANIRSFMFYVMSSIEDMGKVAAPFLFFYFLILLSLGVMKVIATEAVILSPIKEWYPDLPNKWRHVIDAISGLVLILLTIPFFIKGTTLRYPLLTMFQHPPMMYCPLLLMMFTAIAFIYGYGLKRLRQDIDFMLQYFPNVFYCTVWYATPVFCVLVIAVTVFLRDQHEDDGFSRAGNALLWFFFCAIFLPLVGLALWTYVSYYRRGELSNIRRPLGSYSQELVDPARGLGQRPTGAPSVVEHDSNLTRHDAITTLSSIDKDPNTQKLDASLLDLSITKESL